MKKILGLLTIFLLCFNMIVFAQKIPTVEFSGPESLKKGEKVTYSVNIRDVKNLYGVQMKYKFDASKLKITNIKEGKLIKDADRASFGNSGQDAETSPFNFYYTFTGEFEGVEGAGEIITFDVEALKDCEVTFGKSNTYIILVENSPENGIGEMTYNMIGTEKEEVIKPEGGDNTTDSSGNNSNSDNSEVNDGNSTNNSSQNNNSNNNSNNSNSSNELENDNISNDQDNESVDNKNNNESSDNSSHSSDDKIVTSDGDSVSGNDTSSAEASSNSGNMLFYVIICIVILSGISGFIFWKKYKQ